MANVFKTRSRSEWEDRLADAGDLIYEKVQRTLELRDDPQVKRNNYMIDFDHPVLGDIRVAPDAGFLFGEPRLHPQDGARARRGHRNDTD